MADLIKNSYDKILLPYPLKKQVIALIINFQN
jgi:hypothetical protein